VQQAVDLCAAPGNAHSINVDIYFDSENQPENLQAPKIVAVSLEGVIQIQGDITKLQQLSKLFHILRSFTLPFLHIWEKVTGLHDMDEYIQAQLLLSALNITTNISRLDGTFVAKIFRDNDITLLFSQLKIFIPIVICGKPKSSRNPSIDLKDLKNKTNKDALLITQLQSELNKFKEFKVDVESKKLIQQSEIQRLTIKCQEYEDVVEENQLEIEKLKKEIGIISDLEKDRDNYKQLYDELDIEFKRFQCKANENELELETLQSEVKRLKEKCVEFYQKIDEDSKTYELLKNELKVFQHIVGEQDKIIRGKNQQEKGVHPAYCNVCNKFIVGVRYKCGNCDDYDICSNCETSNHDRTHVFIKIKQPIENDKFFRTFLLPKIKIIEKDENGKLTD
ncbi:9248_t:CDS:2, partial [Entrophospora sp. SA101]